METPSVNRDNTMEDLKLLTMHMSRELMSVDASPADIEGTQLIVPKPIEKTPVYLMKEAGIRNFMVQRLEQFGITKLTEVQTECIPKILGGYQMVIANSPTGSGKTLAYAIPITQEAEVDPCPGYALVVTVSRELAGQIADQFKSLFGEGKGTRVICITGGIDYQQQSTKAHTQPSVVVATPGRLKDILSTDTDLKKKLFSRTRYLILDEADQLLGGAFDEQIQYIMSEVNFKKIMFFSATMSIDLQEKLQELPDFDRKFVYNYYEERPGPMIVNRNLSQKYIVTPEDFKDGYLIELLRMVRNDEFPDKIRSMIVFASTCKESEIVGKVLNVLGYPNVILQSHMKQRERLEALAIFKSSQATTLVATDIASRGLDIPSVDLIINYTVPNPDVYIHRIGRAGRSGQKGYAVTFIKIRDLEFLWNIESTIQEKLVELTINEVNVLQTLNEVKSTRSSVEISSLDVNDTYEERMKAYKRKKSFMSEEEEEMYRKMYNFNGDTNCTREPKRQFILVRPTASTSASASTSTSASSSPSGSENIVSSSTI